MTASWQYPVAEPQITDARARELVEELGHQGPKAQAADTFTRYSSAHGCARRLAYQYLGYEPDDGADPAGLAVMNIGTLSHEDLQGAIARRYPDARFEVPTRIGDLTSGHCDADVPSLDAVFEFKTVGAYAFDKAIGLKRRSYRLESPEGPKLAHVVQCGLNARALGRSNVVVGYLGKEAVSVQLAAKVGMRQLDRVLAEWWIPQTVWGPLVDAELARITGAAAEVAVGHLPDRVVVEDDGTPKVIDPQADRPHWSCFYCVFRYRCESDGAGHPERTEIAA